MAKLVGIIGAGISGLLACKYVAENGFCPVVFEARSCIGGVLSQTMEITKLQSPKQNYQFSDFPWPSSVKEDFPDHNQILEYINSYARHFDLLKHIKFNCKVTSVDYEGASEEDMVSWDLWGGTDDPLGPKGKWNITVEEAGRETTKASDIPNIPDIPRNKGPESFAGKVIHSMDYSAMDDGSAAKFIKGKHITIVGMQKSALDLAIECAATNGIEFPCTVVFRSVHWCIPNFSAWGLPLSFLYFNRFAELMVHKPDEGLMLSILATLLTPVRWLTSKFVESYIRWKLPLNKYKMIPNHSFNEDFSSCKIASTGDFYKRVEEGSIILKRSNTLSFCKEGLVINSNIEPIQSDIVILATGYKGDQKLMNIFRSPTLQKYIMGLGSPTKTAPLPLYRGCIHPRIPQLGIIGYSENLLYLHTSEMRCRWIAHLLKGTFKLPRIIKMEEDVLQWDNEMKVYGGEYNLRAKCVSALFIWHNDQLCRDMRCNPRRKKGIFAEIFEPYGAMDYVNL